MLFGVDTDVGVMDTLVVRMGGVKTEQSITEYSGYCVFRATLICYLSTYT